MSHTCPLCCATSDPRRIELPRRHALACPDCKLVWVPRDLHLALEDERARYLLHRNSSDDSDYVGFFESLIAPVAKHLTSPAQVLDFGSGPTPVLAELLRARDYDVTLYDPFFAPDETALQVQYDAVFCCETVEHFRSPLRDWTVLTSAIRPGGVLAGMTLLYDERTRFDDWWYARDLTHVSFYARATMSWIAQRFSLTTLDVGPRYTLFRKANGTP